MLRKKRLAQNFRLLSLNEINDGEFQIKISIDLNTDYAIILAKNDSIGYFAIKYFSDYTKARIWYGNLVSTFRIICKSYERGE